MARRKNRSRHLETSSDGWSIIPGRNRAPLYLALEDELLKLALVAPTAPASSASLPTLPNSEGYDYTSLSQALSCASTTLAASKVADPVRAAVRSLKPGAVKRVLVLGLGSLSGVTRGSSMLQLALVVEVLEIVGFLGKQEGVVFTDPVFTSVDVGFLTRWGTVEGVDMEGKKGKLGENTLLLAPHLDFEVLARHLERYRGLPVLVIANDLRGFLELRVGDRERWEVFKKLFREQGDYIEEALVVKEKGGSGIGRAFNDLAVYWRKGSAMVIKQ